MNGGFYNNPKVDELLDKGVAEPNIDNRIKIYKEIQELLIQDQPFLWLAYPQSYFMYNNLLKGYVLPDLQEWSSTTYYDMWLEAE
jgi:peptide/nickel transport system substrate-binding protein